MGVPEKAHFYRQSKTWLRERLPTELNNDAWYDLLARELDKAAVKYPTPGKCVRGLAKDLKVALKKRVTDLQDGSEDEVVALLLSILFIAIDNMPWEELTARLLDLHLENLPRYDVHGPDLDTPYDTVNSITTLKTEHDLKIMEWREKRRKAYDTRY